MTSQLPKDLQPVVQGTPRVAVVTGAGSGIGRAIALGLAKAGYDVAAIGRNRSKLADVADAHERIRAYPLDIADNARTVQVIETIRDEMGPVDILVANAAVYPRQHFLDQPAEDFAAVMRTNIEGTANTIREVLPGMLDRNMGRIVVMGSLADNRPIPASSAYSVSKGALHPLVRAIAAEIDRSHYPNVLVNELVPGATKTAMSITGEPPESVVPHLMALIDAPAGSVSGGVFLRDRRLFLGETWKGALKRKLLRRN